MALVPLICDWLFKDPDTGDVLTRLQFDSIESLVDPGDLDLTIDHMSIEPQTDGPTLTIPVSLWRSSVSDVESFVARAYDTPKNRWPTAIDPDLSVVFSMGGTRVRVRALSGMGSFDRTTDFLLVDDVPSLTLNSWNASDPMRLWSWIIYHNAVNSLIEHNVVGADLVGF